MLNLIFCTYKWKKAVEGISVIKKLNKTLLCSSLLTTYKLFIRPLLDYADVIYDQTNNDEFSEKTESIHYNIALAITGAIKGTTKEKLYQALDPKSLKDRSWVRRLWYLYKVLSTINYNHNHKLSSQFCVTDF